MEAIQTQTVAGARRQSSSDNGSFHQHQNDDDVITTGFCPLPDAALLERFRPATIVGTATDPTGSISRAVIY